MSNSTTCDLIGEEYCGVLYGIIGSMLFFMCYSCTRGCFLTRRQNNQIQSAINKLPRIHVNDDSEYESPCVICIEDITNGDYICKLPCGHYYHPDCIYPWIIEKNICPLCKVPIISV